ncbi:hypothetical protein QS306_07380 [Paraburkholderia bonniea]|uniref:hypothetical protein n=1 Tax=Paraburkholderia bonniea TaxID=2152891 RepID=UPI0012922A04|nr:hypothetical protein [Paraburkholderia bonniea]WJF88973.1 hypothetical protein QS306_07380 [Paraburkholderia bonniea]WJF92289.1 hypothetical protein QS308_07390 [Paraburkholderia bonniea]
MVVSLERWRVIERQQSENAVPWHGGEWTTANGFWCAMGFNPGFKHMSVTPPPVVSEN